MISDEGLGSKKQHLCVKRMKLILSELQTHRWTVSSGMLLLEYLLPAVIVSEVVPLFTLRKTNFLMHGKNAMIIFTHFKHERSCWRPFFFFFLGIHTLKTDKGSSLAFSRLYLVLLLIAQCTEVS